MAAAAAPTGSAGSGFWRLRLLRLRLQLVVLRGPPLLVARQTLRHAAVSAPAALQLQLGLQLRFWLRVHPQFRFRIKLELLRPKFSALSCSSPSL